MFTDHGKNLIARKIGGVTDACLDFMSLGIGANPVPASISGISDLSHQSGPYRSMLHEIIRVPVLISLPTSEGKVKCIAEIPSSLSCEFTEVGIWTHLENAASAHSSNKTLLSFDNNEAWLYNGTTALVTITSALTDDDYDQHDLVANKAMRSPYDDMLWSMTADRRVRKEGFRFSDSGILVRGNMSTLSTSGTVPFTGTSGDYISLSTPGGIPLTTIDSDDQLKLSYFVSPTDTTTAPDTIRIAVHFRTSDNKYAKWNIKHDPTTINGTTDDESAFTLTASAGTYSLASGQCTISYNSHGWEVGDSVYLSFTSGGLNNIQGVYNVIGITANTFIVNHNATDTTGNVTLVTKARVAKLRDGDTLWHSTGMVFPAQFTYNPNGGGSSGTLSLKSGSSYTGNYNINPVIYTYPSNPAVANCYFTQTTKLVDDNEATGRNSIEYDSGFEWANVTEVRIYGQVGTTNQTKYYLGLDALSFINVDQANPGYGLVAYDVAKNYETRGILTKPGSATSIVFEVQVA